MESTAPKDYERPRKMRKLEDGSAVSSSDSSANRNPDSHLKVFQPELSHSSDEQVRDDQGEISAQIGGLGAKIQNDANDNVLEI